MNEVTIREYDDVICITINGKTKCTRSKKEIVKLLSTHINKLQEVRREYNEDANPKSGGIILY